MSQVADLIEEAYHVAKCSFVRYVIESSEAEVQGDFDRKAYSLLEDWSRECRYSQMALGDWLQEVDRVPVSSSFPIDCSQFNFLSASYLLGPAIEKGQREIEQLEGIARDLASDQRASALLSAVIARQKYYLDRARKLEEERQSLPATPPRIKGTSAAKW